MPKVTPKQTLTKLAKSYARRRELQEALDDERLNHESTKSLLAQAKKELAEVQPVRVRMAEVIEQREAALRFCRLVIAALKLGPEDRDLIRLAHPGGR